MALVRLTSTNRNAPNAVRKIYRPIDPIRLRRPTLRQSTCGAGRPSPANPHTGGPIPHISNNLDGSTKWLRDGKPLEHEQQTVNGAKGAGTAWMGFRTGNCRFAAPRAFRLAGPSFRPSSQNNTRTPLAGVANGTNAR